MTPTGNPLRKGTGVTGRNTIIHGGGQVTAGLFDDPFFFDLNAFNLFKAQALAGNPNAAAVFNNRGVRNIPQNFFGGFNVLAIVLEVPSVWLQTSHNNTMIGFWGRTIVPPIPMLPNGQFDRFGRPAINTVLIPDIYKDSFNSATPPEDPTTFIPIATEELTALFGTDQRPSQRGVPALAGGHHDLRYVQQKRVATRLLRFYALSTAHSN